MNPNRSSACPSFHATQFSRRTLLRVGGAGLLGLTMPKFLRAQDAKLTPAGAPTGAEALKKLAPTAKSVMFLYQFGGPSHIDMFDMKPDAPEGIRGPHKPISSNLSGVQVSEHLPRVAKIMNKVTLIRSMYHTMKNHNSASYYALTGHAPPTDDQRLRDSLDLLPAYGSVVDQLAPVNDDLPTFVSYPHVIADGSITPGQHASFLGKRHDPLFFSQDPNSPDFSLPEFSLPANLPYERVAARREIQKIIDEQSRLLDYSAAAKGLDDYYQRALAMLNSTRLRDAFNLSAEPANVRESYGRTTYGQG